MKTISAEEYSILLKAFVQACNLLTQQSGLRKFGCKKTLTPEEIMLDLINKAKEGRI